MPRPAISPPTPSRRVRVTVTDVASGKSKCCTVYNSTPKQVIDLLGKAVNEAATASEGKSDAA